VRGFPISAYFYRWTVHRALSRLASWFQFDLVHAHAICPDGFAAAGWGQRTGIPVVCTAHGSDIHTYPNQNRLTRFVTQQAIQELEVVIAVSADLKAKARMLAMPKDDIRVIGNGVDLGKFTPIDKQQAREELGLARHAKILLYASRLDRAKGLSDLLLAFETVQARRGDCLLALVGDGPYRQHLEKEIHELGLYDCVFLAGLRPHAEIAKWMSACDLVVQPSLREGAPLPIYEAMACGRPVIASRVGGMPEIIANDELGFLVPPSSPKALAESLLRALEKDWDTRQIRKRGTQNSWGRVADQLLDLYQDVLKRDTSLIDSQYPIGNRSLEHSL
jgi:glycosyltransferase involved in cell wall biosynthesis